MRKCFQLFFGVYTEGGVGAIMIVFPLLLFTRSHGSFHNIILLIFCEISEIDVVSFGLLFFATGSVSKTSFTSRAISALSRCEGKSHYLLVRHMLPNKIINQLEQIESLYIQRHFSKTFFIS